MRGPVLATAGVALCVGAIAANALFLQAGMHPAPLFVTRDRAVAAPPPAVMASADPQVRALQGELSERGYYSGPVDGLIGPLTRAAVEAFGRDAGLPLSGAKPDAILAAIRSFEAGAAPPAAKPVDAIGDLAAHEDPAPAGVAAPRVASVQAALAAAGYGPLTADGVLGPQTQIAISRFQLDEGLSVTGSIDDRLVRRLRDIGALGGA